MVCRKWNGTVDIARALIEGVECVAVARIRHVGEVVLRYRPARIDSDATRIPLHVILC